MRNHTMTRRVLALLLSLLMIIPSVVFSASAEASGVEYLYSVEHDGTNVVVTLTASGADVKLNGGAFGITYPESFGDPDVVLNDKVVTDQGGLYILAGASAGENALIAEYYPLIKEGEGENPDTTSAYLTVPAEGVVLATITFAGVAVADYDVASITENAMSVYALENCDTAYNGKWQVYIHDADELDVASSDVNATDFEWTVNEYDITYTIMEDEKTITAKYGDDVTAPETEVDGYNFVAWYEDEACETETTFPTTMPSGGATLYAKHEVETYTITLDAGEDATIDGEAEITYTIKDEAVVLPDASKEGHEFLGWFDGNDEFVFEQGKTFGDKELTAKFSANEYTITYTINDEENKITQDYGTVVTAPSTTITGYKFEGWYDNAEFTGDPVEFPTSMPAGGATLYAKHTIETYDITVDANEGVWAEGEEPEGLKYTFGDSVEDILAQITAEPTKEGYEFVEWTIDGYIAGTTTGAITVKANWVAVYTVTYNEAVNDEYTITVVDEDDNVVASGTKVKDGTVLIITATPTEAYNAPTITVNEVAFTSGNEHTVAGDVEIVVTPGAKKTYTIGATYTAEHVTVEGLPENKVEYGSKVVVTFTAKDGYQIDKIEAENGVVDLAAGTVTYDKVTANDTITVTSSVKKITVTFDLAGGTADGATEGKVVVEAEYGTELTAPVPTKTGYTFAGWDKEIPETMPAENVTITAQWTVNQYTITFDTVGGSAIEPIKQDYNTAVTAPADPTKTGYKFTGWDVEIPETMPAENITITAQWTINQYTITFDTDGGSEIASITQDYGTDVTAPAAPTKLGYTFAGWDKVVPATMPAENITITAQWTIEEYTITLVPGDGANVDPTSIKYTVVTDVTLPTPTKTGYAFEGWYEGEATEKFVYVKGTTTGDKTLTAKWAEGQVNYTVETYTMGTDGQYGTPVTDTKTATTGDTVTVTPETKEGFTVAGTSVLEGTVKADGSTVLSVYYSRNQYTFKTVIDGAETSTSYYFEQAVVAPAAPEKTGYTFKEWTIVGADAMPANMPANDVTVTATWTINQYNVKFVVDGTAVYNENLEFGATIVAPADPTKTGYTFTGWTPAVDATVPAKDVTYTATWEVKNIPVTIPEVVGATVTVTYNDGTQDVVLTKDTENAAIPFDKTFTVKVELAEGYGESEPTVTVTGAAEAEGVYTMTAETVTIVVADVEKNVYNVTYFEKIGDVEKELTIAGAQTTVEHGANVTLPAVPAKTGYTAGTWVADANYADNKATGDIKFVVTYTINKYTVKYFDGENELTDLAKTYNHGDALALATVPTKDHYTGAWKLTTGTLGENDTVTGNLVYTVQWTPVQYKVTYTADNEGYTIEVKNGEDTVANDATVVYNTELTVIVTPKTGYNANAAVIKVNGAAITDGKFNISADSTITVEGVAKNVYNVTYFEKVDGVETEITIDGAQTTVEHGATVTLPAVPAKTGYTAGEWTVEAGYTEGVATGNVKVVVTYTINKYTVKYFDGASELTTLAQTYNHGEALALATVPTKDHYTGTWELTSGTLGENDTVTGNLVYTVEWTPVEYTITLNPVDGAIKDGASATITYTVETESITLPDAEKANYRFDGWFDGENKFEYVKGTTTGNKTLTAKYTINKYTVTLQGEDGQKLTDEKYQIADVEHGAAQPTLPEAPEKPYNTASWTLVSTESVDADNKVIGNLVYKATYTVKTATVAMTLPAGVTVTVMDGETPVANGGTVNQGTLLTITFELDEAYDNSQATLEVTGATPTEGKYLVDTASVGITVNGVTKNVYNVTYFQKIGNVETAFELAEAQKTVEHGETVTLPAVPAKTGYTAGTWVADANYADNKATGNVKFVVTYTINQYTYTFNLDGGTADGELTITADYGSAITAPTNLKKESTAQYSYEFKEWSPAVPATMPENGGSSKAIWTETVRTYKVTAPAGEGYTVAIAGADELDAVAYGTKLTYTVTATEGYEAPTVKVNGTDAALTGEIEVKGDVTIEVTAGALKTYDITLTGENVSTADTLTGIAHGSPKTVTITAAEGYDITAVEADGATVEIADDKASATVTYASVTKAETITVTAAIKTFAVSASTGTGYTATITGAADLGAVAYGTTVTLTVALDAAYTQSEVVVKVGEEVLVAEADGSYKYVVKADTAFDISGVNAKNKYALTVPVLDAEKDEIADGTVTDVEHGSVYNGTFTLPAANSQMTGNIAITIDGTAGVATYDPDAKAYKYTIPEVTGEHKVVITGELVLNTYNVTFTGIKNADGTPAADVVIPVKHGNKVVGAPTPVTYTEAVDGYKVEYTFKEWTTAFDAEAVVTEEATYTATYNKAVAVTGIVDITVATLRGELVTDGKYTLPENTDYQVNAVVTVKLGDADVTNNFVIVENGAAITIDSKEGGVAAGTYTITVSKQRYLDLIITVTVTNGETVGTDASIALTGGDIVDTVGTTAGDNKVNINDFIVAIRAFDKSASITAQAADINENGTISVDDLLALKSSFGATAATTAVLPPVQEITLD